LELGRWPLMTILPAAPPKPRRLVSPKSIWKAGTWRAMSSAVRGAYWAKKSAW
jgi:hypothetical protein